MKQLLLYLLCLSSILPLSTADLEPEDLQALERYYASAFSDAIPGFQKAIANHINVQKNECRLAQCLAAQAIDLQNHNLLSQAIGLFTQSNNNFKASNSNEIVFVADEGLGDTIMWGYFLKVLQTKNNRTYTLHLTNKNSQTLLAPLLQQSDISNITTGNIAQHAGKNILPFVGAIVPDLVFVPEKLPYLKANAEAYAYWQQELKQHQGLKLVITWCSSDKPVLGGRTLKRNVPLSALINIALQADANAHIFLVQARHRIISQSEFNRMNKDEADKNNYHIIADTYMSHITPVILADDTERFGPFQSTLALFALGCVYLGADTVTPHIAGHAGAPAAIIIPSNNSSASSRDWRWGHNNKCLKGKATVWYPENKVRIFEIDPSNEQEATSIIAFLKQCHEQQKQLSS